MFLLKFATGGAYMIVGLSDEMHNPQRHPLVMTVATVVVALLYALVALASVGVVHWRDMIDQLTVAGQAFMPGWAMTIFLSRVLGWLFVRHEFTVHSVAANLFGG